MRNYSSIKELVIATCTREGQFPSYDKLTALVLEHFPRSGWKKSHYLWYKEKIKSREIIIPKLYLLDEEPNSLLAIDEQEILQELQSLDTTSVEPTKHAEIEHSIETTLSLGRDLHSYLTQTVSDLEADLVLVPNGIEYPTEAGKIDLLARDHQDQLVVIEMLAGKATDAVLGQLLVHIGCISEQNPGQVVRGILVASEFDKRVIYATKALAQIKLVKYSIAFKLEEIA